MKTLVILALALLIGATTSAQVLGNCSHCSSQPASTTMNCCSSTAEPMSCCEVSTSSLECGLESNDDHSLSDVITYGSHVPLYVISVIETSQKYENTSLERSLAYDIKLRPDIVDQTLHTLSSIRLRC